VAGITSSTSIEPRRNHVLFQRTGNREWFGKFDPPAPLTDRGPLLRPEMFGKNKLAENLRADLIDVLRGSGLSERLLNSLR
jgi:hypothetical protein